jgi:class 3 adenylate cyclase
MSAARASSTRRDTVHRYCIARHDYRQMTPSPEPRPMPEGTVTFLFSDLEGSTGLLERYGGAAAGTALERHHRLYEELVDRNQGVIFETVGDAVYAAFSTPANSASRPVCEPGAMMVMPVPITIEQADPGGVSCTNRRSSVTWKSWSALKPTWST